MKFSWIQCMFFCAITFLLQNCNCDSRNIYRRRSIDLIREDHNIPRAKNHRYYDGHDDDYDDNNDNGDEINTDPYEHHSRDYDLSYDFRNYYDFSKRIDTFNNSSHPINEEDEEVILHDHDHPIVQYNNHEDHEDHMHINSENRRKYIPLISDDNESQSNYEGFGPWSSKDKTSENYDNKNLTSEILNIRRQYFTRKCEKCKCGVQRKRTASSFSNEFPWLAMLAYFGRFYCSGSLINNLYVISAGHCTRGYQTAQITVVFIDYEQDTIKERKIARVFRPQGYDERTLNNDISLLRLSKSIRMRNSNIHPICLPHPRTSFGGQDGIIAGWSTTSDDDFSSSVIQKAIVPIITNQRCRNSEHGEAITNKMICTRSPPHEERDSCFGGSGGPLMTIQGGRYRLIGIISWSKGCGRRNFPNVYTRVTKFNKWIRRFSTGACWCT